MLLKGDVAIRAPHTRVSKFRCEPDQIGPGAPGVKTEEVINPLERYREAVLVGPGGIAKFKPGRFASLSELLNIARRPGQVEFPRGIGVLCRTREHFPKTRNDVLYEDHP